MRRSKLSDQYALRLLLDDLDSCLKCTLDHVKEPKALQDFCVALLSLIKPLCFMLRDNLQGYAVELPLSSEEHKNVDWLAEQEKFLNHAESFMDCEGEDDPNPSDIVATRLREMAHYLGDIKRSFQCLNNSAIYIDYCEREMAHFRQYGWNQELDNITDELAEDFTSDDAQKCYNDKMVEFLDKLVKEAPKAVNKDERIIYLEPLGHKIWTKAHQKTNPVEVKTYLTYAVAAEHFGKLANQKVTFVPQKINPDQANEAYDSLTQEQRDFELKREKYLLIKTNRLQSICFLTNWTKAYFGSKLTEVIVNSMYSKMFEDETLIVELSEKFAERNRINTVCRIVGEFYKNQLYKFDVKASELAEAIKITGSPDKASRARYIRDAFPEDDILGNWVRANLPGATAEEEDVRI